MVDACVTHGTPAKAAGGRPVTAGNMRATRRRQHGPRGAGGDVGVPGRGDRRPARRRADRHARAAGATVLHGPAIRTHPVAVDGALAAALDDLIARPPDVTVLSTGIGVRGVVEAAEVPGPGRGAWSTRSAGSRVYARGPKAHGAAVTVGLPVHVELAVGRVERDPRPSWAAPASPGSGSAVQLDGARTQPLADALTGPRRRRRADPRLPLVAARRHRPAAAARPGGRRPPGRRRDLHGPAADREPVRDRRNRRRCSTGCAAGFARGSWSRASARCAPRPRSAAGFGTPVVPVRPRLGSMVVRWPRRWRAGR